ncbi:hypothetical protein [Devosia ginsengisoli]|uniref:Chitin-binding type-3 domain-containing protein n=1 Tax=Devosia ginsengisoli TaxID=400770 RepID=A0A5B8LRH0_9HYPH|nr:hypothetical protein [Devosia ginsengisoli]QDZ10511.1 hypothetical protein FPZ08_06960 [Devosia ginsengisoli]
MTEPVSAGTVTVANGGTTVTGTDTFWVGKVRKGDLFTVPAQGVFARITADAMSNTSLSINAWPGTEVTDGAYEILVMPDEVGNAQRVRELLAQMSVVEANGRGLFFRFSDQTADADPGAGYLRTNHIDIASSTGGYFDNLDANGATVAAILDSWDDEGTAAARGQVWLRSVADPAAFHALKITDTVVDGTGYRKLTWDYVGGSGSFAADEAMMVMFSPQGADGTNAILGVWQGAWVTATAYDVDDLVEQDGSTYICLEAHTSDAFSTDLAADKWDLAVEKGDQGNASTVPGPTGPKGINWQGDYSAMTDYVEDDGVLYNGSSWRALQATTGNAPPTLPTTSNTYWLLVARAGTDGAGTVTSIVAGDGIAVDNTDPTAPIISVTVVGGGASATLVEAAALTPSVAPEFVRTEGYAEAGDGGGALYKKVDTEPAHAGKFSVTLDDGVTVVWYEIASNPMTPAMVGGNANDAAEIAFRAGLPLRTGVQEEAKLFFNPTTEAAANTDTARYDALKLAIDWQRSCMPGDDSKIWIEIADGYHYIEGAGFVLRGGHTLYLRSSGTFTAKINGVSSWAHQGSNVFNPVVQLDTPLPAGILGGDPVGFRNVIGNGDAEALTGGGFITSIITGDAGARTALRAMIRIPRTTSPTVSTTTTYSAGISSELLIPNGGLVMTGGWNGSSQEGFFDLWWGARMHCDQIGLSYNGGATTDKELIMVRYGAHLYTNQTLLIGADPSSGKVLRLFGEGAGARLDGSIVGGGQYADRLVSVEGLAEFTGSRTSLGHAAGIGLILGPGCRTYFNQNHIASCDMGVRVTGMGYANIQSTRVSECVTGLVASEGQIFVDANTILDTNTTPSTTATNGTIIGTPSVV